VGRPRAPEKPGDEIVRSINGVSFVVFDPWRRTQQRIRVVTQSQFEAMAAEVADWVQQFRLRMLRELLFSGPWCFGYRGQSRSWAALRAGTARGHRPHEVRTSDQTAIRQARRGTRAFSACLRHRKGIEYAEGVARQPINGYTDPIDAAASQKLAKPATAACSSVICWPWPEERPTRLGVGKNSVFDEPKCRKFSFRRIASSEHSESNAHKSAPPMILWFRIFRDPTAGRRRHVPGIRRWQEAVRRGPR
jgi:hypothetical protein